jgi:hypothetical protein
MTKKVSRLFHSILSGILFTKAFVIDELAFGVGTNKWHKGEVFRL